MLRKIPTIYVDNPILWGVYSYNWNDYILIDDIPDETDFMCHAIVMDLHWRVYIEKHRARLDVVNIIKK